ncbi:SirB1 family protein [Leptothoe sp. PORK10 BA2]|uniref:SirB1 family protein n=1 Tax=Leptothoe sp. PORK10 BA2 TaxID=3110254 RepID=UPI002B1F172D|nr:transglutaminase-like domain-containing protein [Leptothoe sp. PORK10 BA2]MEA5462446.1 transglutaminase-like domain-containing protein [Leptothoe sp. PORK10 BA2]
MPLSFSQAQQRFRHLITQPTLNLAAAALCPAQEMYPDCDPAVCYQQLDHMAAAIKPNISTYPLKTIQAINHQLYTELGFRGNQIDYYDPDNSYLNRVLERRVGIPITLALVYLEVAQRLDFPMVGVGMPGHFLICPTIEEMAVYVDPFNRGEVLFEPDCQTIFQGLYGTKAGWKADYLTPISAKSLLARLLNNLKLIYLNRRDLPHTLTILNYLLLLFPQQPGNSRDRGLIHYQLQNLLAARSDLETYLAQSPGAADRHQISRLLDHITENL